MTPSNSPSTIFLVTKMKRIQWFHFCFKSLGLKTARTSKSNSAAKTFDTVVSRNFKIPLLGRLAVGHSRVNFEVWQRSIVAVDVGRRRLALSSDKDTMRDINRTYVRSWTVDWTVTRKRPKRN